MYRVVVLFLLSINVQAEVVTINVQSASNNPVFQAVVYLEPETPITSTTVPQVSVMDQIDRQFVPHILPVQKGSDVIFPNSDSIKHHVYSFSPAKQFELKLYRDSMDTAIDFPTAGEVELGCNVHDWMLAYIWVVDTPYFAKTTQQGQVSLDVPAGNYRVKVWHPRIQDDLASLALDIQVKEDMAENIQLTKPLLKDLALFEEETDGFSDYDE